MSPAVKTQFPGMVSADTTADAARLQAEIWKRMSPGQRLRVGFELSAGVRRRLEQGVRMRHPDYDDETVQRAVFLLMRGPDAFAEVFPGCTVEP